MSRRSIPRWSSDQTIPTSKRAHGSATRPHVVVVFGRTGVGVSSLVNLILGHPASDDHPDASTRRARHPRPKPHAMTLRESGKHVRLYEVPGFTGRASDGPILGAIRDIERAEGIDLFVYCLRKLPTTIMPQTVRFVRESVPADVPMVAVVTELERFEVEGDMEAWWDAPVGNRHTNGSWIEMRCGEFDGHACVTTLPRRDVDLVERLRKRRDISEERIRRLIAEQCAGQKRRASDPLDSDSSCPCLSNLFTLLTLNL